MDNARRLVGNLLRVWSADFLDEGPVVVTLARAVLAGPALALVALPVVLLMRSVRSGPSPVAAEGPGEELLYLVFWGLVVGLLVAGSVVSRLAVDNADRAVGYLTPWSRPWLPPCPLAATRARWARAGVGVGVALLCALGAADVATSDEVVPGTTRPYVIDGPDVVAALGARGLTRGYAAYGSASGFTYQSAGESPCGRVPLPGRARPPQPVRLLRQPGGQLVHAPARGQDLPGGRPRPASRRAAAPPAELGQPSEVITVGSQTIFVYPYDIAGRFGPTF